MKWLILRGQSAGVWHRYTFIVALTDPRRCNREDKRRIVPRFYLSLRNGVIWAATIRRIVINDIPSEITFRSHSMIDMAFQFCTITCKAQ